MGDSPDEEEDYKTVELPHFDSVCRDLTLGFAFLSLLVTSGTLYKRGVFKTRPVYMFLLIGNLLLISSLVVHIAFPEQVFCNYLPKLSWIIQSTTSWCWVIQCSKKIMAVYAPLKHQIYQSVTELKISLAVCFLTAAIEGSMLGALYGIARAEVELILFWIHLVLGCCVPYTVVIVLDIVAVCYSDAVIITVSSKSVRRTATQRNRHGSMSTIKILSPERQRRAQKKKLLRYVFVLITMLVIMATTIGYLLIGQGPIPLLLENRDIPAQIIYGSGFIVTSILCLYMTRTRNKMRRKQTNLNFWETYSSYQIAIYGGEAPYTYTNHRLRYSKDGCNSSDPTAYRKLLSNLAHPQKRTTQSNVDSEIDGMVDKFGRRRLNTDEPIGYRKFTTTTTCRKSTTDEPIAYRKITTITNCSKATTNSNYGLYPNSQTFTAHSSSRKSSGSSVGNSSRKSSAVSSKSPQGSVEMPPSQKSSEASIVQSASHSRKSSIATGLKRYLRKSMTLEIIHSRDMSEVEQPSENANDYSVYKSLPLKASVLVA